MNFSRLAVGAVAAGVGAFFVRRHVAVSKADPDLRHHFNYRPIIPTNKPVLDFWRKHMYSIAGIPDGLNCRKVLLTGDDGGQVPVFVYSDPDALGPAPVLLWIHGGGLIMGKAELDHAYCGDLAKELGVTVVSVDYRLAPEFAFPVPLDDCMTALRWVFGLAGAGVFDASRIAVSGGSAGGGLAAALAQRATDEGFKLCFQSLTYPMLDCRTGHSRSPGRGEFSWTAGANRFGWRSYLGYDAPDGDVRPYAVPALREDLSGLPPAWIGVGSLDLFFDEDVAYAQRLREAGVECELVTVEGMYHAAEHLRPEAAKMVDFRASLVAALRRGMCLG